MVGLILLFILSTWLFSIVLVSWLITIIIKNKLIRYPLMILIIPILFLLPVIDEISDDSSLSRFVINSVYLLMSCMQKIDQFILLMYLETQ